MNKDTRIKYRNLYIFLAAAIWHLNNKDKDGNPTTKMNIPNLVFSTIDKKIAQFPADREMTETEALELARKNKS